MMSSAADDDADNINELLKSYEQYLMLKYGKTRASRYKPYLVVANDFCNFLSSSGLGSKDINLQTCTSYINYLINERKFKISSASTTANRLKTFIRFAGYDRVADLLPIPRPSSSEGEEEGFGSSISSLSSSSKEEPVIFLPEDTIIYLIHNCTYDYFDIALIQTMYFFALRRGEAILLRRDWIDHNDKTMKIYRLKTNYPYQRLPFTEPYTEITDTYGVLRYYINEYPANSSDAPLFILPKHGQRTNEYSKLTMNTLNYRVGRMFSRALRTKDIPEKHYTLIKHVLEQERDISTHIFRHSRATNMILKMIERGEPVSLFRVQQWLGHKMQQHTTRYIHLAAKYLGKDYDRIEVLT